jgi:hypothetical protein
MLDPHTLQKIENWLQVRADEQTKRPDANLHNSIGGVAKSTIEKLIEELHNKRLDIEQAIEAGGKHGNLLKEKDGKRGTVYRCPTCNAKRSLIRTYFSESHVTILKKIFKYCVDNRAYHIKTKNIGTLSHSDYCNIAQLQRFGFIYFPE